MLRNIEITRLLRYNRANMKELFEAEVWLRQMARLRNFVRKNSPRGFRAVLFRMVLMIFLSMKINQNFSGNVFQCFSKIFFYGKIESEFI